MGTAADQVDGAGCCRGCDPPEQASVEVKGKRLNAEYDFHAYGYRLKLEDAAALSAVIRQRRQDENFLMSLLLDQKSTCESYSYPTD
jgi:hypothetical protein